MRPTNLCYRSPKEKTGEYDFPIITHAGNRLFNNETATKSDFPIAKRFLQYKIDADRLPEIGPGTYDLRKSSNNQKPLNPVTLAPFNQKKYLFTHKLYDLDALIYEYEVIQNKAVDDFTAKKEKKTKKKDLAYLNKR